MRDTPGKFDGIIRKEILPFLWHQKKPDKPGVDNAIFDVTWRYNTEVACKKIMLTRGRKQMQREKDRNTQK